MIIVRGGTPDDWGLIPSFLDEADPRPAKEQFNAHYISGWSPFPGFSFDPKSLTLQYPGDPPYRPVSVMLFRNEVIILYPSSWVLITTHEREPWEVCRMD